MATSISGYLYQVRWGVFPLKRTENTDLRTTLVALALADIGQIRVVREVRYRWIIDSCQVLFYALKSRWDPLHAGETVHFR